VGGGVKLRVRKMGRLQSDGMNRLIRNLRNLGYTLEYLDYKRPLRSISISMVGFGSPPNLTPSLEKTCSRIG